MQFYYFLQKTKNLVYNLIFDSFKDHIHNKATYIQNLHKNLKYNFKFISIYS